VTTQTVYLLSAEIVLLFAAVLIYVLGAFLETKALWSRMAAAAVLAAAVVLALTAAPPARMGTVVLDPLAAYARWFALGAGLLLVLMTSRPLAARGAAEYAGSLLLVLVGLMLSASADDLILLFLGLELISIPTYILLFLGRGDGHAREATAKYFFLSILASALLLYGFSFLYGTTGSTQLHEIGLRLLDGRLLVAGSGKLAKLGLVLIFAGLGFKLTAVPFHFYAPDVYQGTSHANAGLLSVLPKTAALVALVRIVAIAMPNLAPYTWHIALVLSLATMTLGNLLALWQDNLRRLLAYSSIAHSGYMLIGLAVAMAGHSAGGSWDGIAAALFYLVPYATATLGAFAAFTYLGRAGQQLDAVDELAGLGRTRPLVAVWIALFMFSLAGVPPLAGFWGKLALFQSALAVDGGLSGGGSIRFWFIGLAIAGVLNAAIAAAYYLRVVAVMYFRTPLGTPKAEGGPGAWSSAAICAALIVVLGVYSKPLMQAAVAAAAGGRQSATVAASPAPDSSSSSSFILHPLSFSHASAADQHD
jgi:NADH-quinone oxidoreductase subunit N